jgi:hypothetical protein
VTAAQAKAQAERRRAAGLCSKCGKNPSPRGVTCAPCRDRNRAISESARRERGAPVKCRSFCSEKGCKQISQARGLCQTHYCALWRAEKKTRGAAICECGEPRTAVKPANRPWACERCQFLDSREARMSLGFTWGGQS